MIDPGLISDIEAYLESSFVDNQDRLIHIENVKKVAISLAKIYQVDLASVIVASLLHDATKHISDDENMRLAKLAYPDLDLTMYPKGCLHAINAEALAKKRFGINDQSILDAIRYHCTGRKDMNPVEKIIFVSDYIEESREFVTEALKRLAFSDIDKAIYQIMKQTKAYILASGQELSPLTEQALKEYETKNGGIE